MKAEQPKSEQPKQSEDDAALDDLDEYTKAAIIALRNRSASKKQEASLRRKNLLVNKKPAAAVSPKPEPTTEHKSAAAPSAAASTQPKSGPLRKAARKATAPDIVPRAKIFGAMPKSKPSDGSNPAPIHYNGGVIYTSWSSRKFRALTTRGDVHTEKSKCWTSNSRKPCIDAWKFCVAAIDAARKK